MGTMHEGTVGGRGALEEPRGLVATEGTVVTAHSLFSSTSSADSGTMSSPATGSSPGTQRDLFWKERGAPSAGRAASLPTTR